MLFCTNQWIRLDWVIQWCPPGSKNVFFLFWHSLIMSMISISRNFRRWWFGPVAYFQFIQYLVVICNGELSASFYWSRQMIELDPIFSWSSPEFSILGTVRVVMALQPGRYHLGIRWVGKTSIIFMFDEVHQICFLLCRWWSKASLLSLVQILLCFYLQVLLLDCIPSTCWSFTQTSSYEVSLLATLNSCVNSAVCLSSDSRNSLISN